MVKLYPHLINHDSMKVHEALDVEPHTLLASALDGGK